MGAASVVYLTLCMAAALTIGLCRPLLSAQFKVGAWPPYPRPCSDPPATHPDRAAHASVHSACLEPRAWFTQPPPHGTADGASCAQTMG